jgi:hypothetical protein
MVLASDFENTLAELVQMKEIISNTGLKKAFIKQSFYKQQENISRLLSIDYFPIL